MPRYCRPKEEEKRKEEKKTTKERVHKKGKSQR